MTQPLQPTIRARQLLALLPVLQQWAVLRAQQAGADHGLSLRQYAALHAIREGAVSPGELARRWHVTPAVLTGIIDRLERHGMVRREPDPDDRRRLRLALTEAGRTASHDLEQALVDDLASNFAQESSTDLAELGRALDLLDRTLAVLHAHAGTAARNGASACGEEELTLCDDTESA